MFCGAFCEDTPWLFACGSSDSDIVVWDTIEDNNVKLNFEERMVAPVKKVENLIFCRFLHFLKEKKTKKEKKEKGMELEENQE